MALGIELSTAVNSSLNPRSSRIRCCKGFVTASTLRRCTTNGTSRGSKRLEKSWGQRSLRWLSSTQHFTTRSRSTLTFMPFRIGSMSRTGSEGTGSMELRIDTWLTATDC